MLAHIQEVVAAIERIRAERSRVLVAIDGPGGSGKSTLAAVLARAIECAVVAGDDFYRVSDPAARLALGPQEGYARYFDWERLQAQVLEPLCAGRTPRYNRYDWLSGALGEAVDLPPRAVTVVEGVYAFRPELRKYYDLSILVETPRGERRRRLKTRDENDEIWLSRWDAAEKWYFANVLKPSEADFVVSGCRDGRLRGRGV